MQLSARLRHARLPTFAKPAIRFYDRSSCLAAFLKTLKADMSGAAAPCVRAASLHRTWRQDLEAASVGPRREGGRSSAGNRTSLRISVVPCPLEPVGTRLIEKRARWLSAQRFCQHGLSANIAERMTLGILRSRIEVGVRCVATHECAAGRHLALGPGWRD